MIDRYRIKQQHTSQNETSVPDQDNGSDELTSLHYYRVTSELEDPRSSREWS